jgi:thiol:disulfide interchange protein DsbA
MNLKTVKRAMGVFAFVLIAAGQVQAQEQEAAPYQEGLHYFEIDGAPVMTGDSSEVVELFSYLCTHCNTFDPYIESWARRLPENVKFRRIHVAFGRESWEMYARGFITAQMMDLPEAAHTALMDRLWKEKKILRSMDELADFYAGFGADKDQFLSTARSFAVDGRLRKNQQLVRTWGIRGTPSLVVNQRYRVSGSAAVPSFDAMLDVVDYLIDRDSAGGQQISASAD